MVHDIELKNQTAIGQSSQLSESRINTALVLFAGLCLGLSITLFIAANWDNFLTSQKFLLLQAVFVASCALAVIFTNLRVSLLILAVFAIGGILALFAQSYGSSNDPWQLFAIWALFALPLALAAKNQLVWGLELLLILVAYSLFISGLDELSYTAFEVRWLYWLGYFLIGLFFYPYSQLKPWLGKYKPEACFYLALNLAILFAVILLIVPNLNYFFNPDLIWCILSLTGLIGILYGLKNKRLSLYITSLLVLDMVVFLFIGYNLLQFIPYGWSKSIFVFIIFILFSCSLVLFYFSYRFLDGIIHKLAIKVTKPQVNTDYFKLILLTVCATLSGLLLIALIVGLLVLTFEVDTTPPFYLVSVICLVGGIILAQKSASFFQAVLSFNAIFSAIAIAAVCYTIDFYDKLQYPILDEYFVDFLIIKIAIALFALVALSKINWHTALYSFAAFLLLYLHQPLSSINQASDALYASNTSIQLISVALILLVYATKNSANSLFNQAKSAIVLSAGSAGLLLAMLVSTGATLLVAGLVPEISNQSIDSASFLTIFRYNFYNVVPWLNGGLIICAWYLTSQELASLKRIRFGLVALIFLVLGFLQPSISLAFVILLLALALANSYLIAFAVVTIIWILGAFYYSINGLLIEKAVLLVLMAILLFMAYYLGKISLQQDTKEVKDARSEIVFWGTKQGTIAGLVLLSLALCLVSINWQIGVKENLKTTGTKVLIALAPVDPRSLVQGDYMELSFSLEGEYTAGKAYLDLDQDGVATLSREAKAGEKFLQLKKISSHWFNDWQVPARAWFFKQGDAAKWEQAKYGILAVGDKGESILIGMADENKQPIIADRDKE